MKNFILTGCAAMLATCSMNAQDTYFATNFNDGIPTSFTLHDIDQRTPSIDMQKLGFAVGTPWIATTEPDADGNQVACSTSWYKNAGTSNDWMITGGIEIKSEKAVLRWRSRATDKDYRDGMAVYISEKGAAVDNFDTSAPVYSAKKESYAWTEHNIDLSGYKGKTIYIAFVNNSTDANCLYVDDIFVGVPSKVSMALDLGRVVKGYGDINVTGKAFTADGQSHTGFTIGYRVDGKTVEQTFNETINADKATDFSLDTPIHIDRNQTIKYEAWIKCDGDSAGITGKTSAYPLKLVSEEVTGTWCGYCVRGIVGMKKMREKYPDTFIGIAIHNDSNPKWPDAMATGVEDYHDYIYSSCGISGYPHCVFSRNPNYSIDPGYMEEYYKAIMNATENNTGIELKAAYDSNTGKINATTDVYFAQKQTETNYRLAYVIIENNVHRTHADLGLEQNKASGYDQNNYYANNAHGEMGGFENLPSTVSAEQMWYNDVARSIYPEPKGEEGIIPADIAEGGHFSHNVSLDIPSNVLNAENTEVIVLLLDKNGIIVNADKVVADGIATGISSVKTGNKSVDSDAFYNMEGMRVGSNAKGLLIHNGKKVVR